MFDEQFSDSNETFPFGVKLNFFGMQGCCLELGSDWFAGLLKNALFQRSSTALSNHASLMVSQSDDDGTRVARFFLVQCTRFFGTT
jgi:hypothetical protein